MPLMRLTRWSILLTTSSRSPYYIYIAKCNDHSLYCGITNDPDRRLKEHNTGRRGAKYTRSRRPVLFVFLQPVCCKSCALKLEHKIKSLTKIKKLQLISSPSMINDLRPECVATHQLSHEPSVLADMHGLREY